MIRLGLTGSIGMGKSTTARLFAEEGAPVFDSDATVHALYAPGGAAVEPVAAAFPGVKVQGAIDRVKLSERVQGDPEGMARLEAIVHPLVAAGRDAFLEQARDAPVVVFDIPLLFEAKREDMVDAVVVVSAPAELQRERVLARPGMTKARFEAILARQLPDAEKRARADFVINTALGVDAARDQVRYILRTVTRPGWTPRDRPATGPGGRSDS